MAIGEKGGLLEPSFMASTTIQYSLTLLPEDETIGAERNDKC